MKISPKIFLRKQIDHLIVEYTYRFVLFQTQVYCASVSIRPVEDRILGSFGFQWSIHQTLFEGKKHKLKNLKKMKRC